jgi:hypothetical protein
LFLPGSERLPEIEIINRRKRIVIFSVIIASLLLCTMAAILITVRVNLYRWWQGFETKMRRIWHVTKCLCRREYLFHKKRVAPKIWSAVAERSAGTALPEQA